PDFQTNRQTRRSLSAPWGENWCPFASGGVEWASRWSPYAPSNRRLHRSGFMATVTEPGTTIPSLTDEPFVTLIENQFAVAAIEQFTEVESDNALRSVYLHGPAGNGKS